MTDNEIIKALECCKYEYDTKCELCCYNFYSRTGCRGELRRNALDLITRQQAEIERLQNAYKQCAWERDVFAKDTRKELTKHISICEAEKTEIKSKAIKEFAEKLEKPILSQLSSSTLEKKEAYYFCLNQIDNLVKEMVGE